MGYDFKDMTAAQLREYAQSCRTESARSFERSDTDGFLSQKANDVTASVYELQATIVENGGRALFLALYDLDGNVVPAIYEEGQYGYQWKLLDPHATGSSRVLGWFSPSKAKTPGKARENDAKKGFYVGYALFPAVADMGASGRYTWYAKAERIDDRDFSDVVPVDNGINECEDAERWYRVQDGRFSRGE